VPGAMKTRKKQIVARFLARVRGAFFPSKPLHCKVRFGCIRGADVEKSNSRVPR
jgi:hypothetical protein